MHISAHTAPHGKGYCIFLLFLYAVPLDFELSFFVGRALEHPDFGLCASGLMGSVRGEQERFQGNFGTVCWWVRRSDLRGTRSTNIHAIGAGIH